ncbi:MAG: ribonuclease [Barnesiella sp.]|nr:ribonuclease [Barnesiella sp.]MBD5344826.1 ribonuclease [Bacteroides sp.]
MSTHRSTSLLAIIIAAVASLSAQIPAGYYDRLNGKCGAELKNAAYEIISPHTEISSYSDLPRYFQVTDVYPESSRWWDMYSDIELFAPSFRGLNREHSFPKSWWGGNTDIPAYIDLNHLYPSEAAANQAKSNYPLGVVANASFDNGLVKVGSPVSGQGGGASKVFEPADEYKGDFARTYFYMATCYQNLTWKYTFMVQSDLYPTLTPWAMNLLLEWAEKDPVSEKEVMRNEHVYMYQNNRNPFIDFPELANHIWGNRKTEPFKVDETPQPGDVPVLITPVQDMSLDFGEVAVGKSATAKLLFHGQNLTKDLSVVVAGTDRKLFTPESRTVSYRLANSSAGTYLNITYTPTETGDHTATLNVYDGDLTGTGIYVYLRGSGADIPSLSPVVALPPQDVTADSYLASWEVPYGDVVDYYVMSRTRYVGGATLTEEIECEENFYTVTGFADSDQETYSVQSVRLGYRSPESNLVFVTHSGLTTVGEDMPLAAETPGGGVIRFTCAGVHTDVRIYDITGRLFATLPELTDGMEITLPAGIYFIVTATHATPLRVVVR